MAKKSSDGSENGRVNGGSAARNAAVKRLIASYPEAWTDFLKEERDRLGLPERKPRSRIQTLAQSFISAGLTPDQVNDALAAAGFKSQV